MSLQLENKAYLFIIYCIIGPNPLRNSFASHLQKFCFSFAKVFIGYKRLLNECMKKVL